MSNDDLTSELKTSFPPLSQNLLKKALNKKKLALCVKEEGGFSQYKKNNEEITKVARSMFRLTNNNIET